MAGKEEIPQYVTRQQLADLLDLHETTIRNYEKEGILYRHGRGQYPFKESIESYVKMRIERAMKASPETAVDLDKEEWETRERRAKALKLELALEREAGAVIAKEDYTRSLVILLSPIQQALKNIPHRWSPQLTHLDLRSLKVKMEELVYALLTELNTPAELPDFSEIDKIERELEDDGS